MFSHKYKNITVCAAESLSVVYKVALSTLANTSPIIARNTKYLNILAENKFEQVLVTVNQLKLLEDTFSFSSGFNGCLIVNDLFFICQMNQRNQRYNSNL